MRPWRNAKILAWLGVAAVQAACLCSADEPVAHVAASNAPAPAIRIPKSEFSDSLPGGRNPFFPHSQQQLAANVSTNAPRAATSVLVYMGMSGPAERRLAVINSRSFGVGEEGEVVAAGSRIRIRCEEIREDLAVVSVGSPPQRVELRLQKRF